MYKVPGFEEALNLEAGNPVRFIDGGNRVVTHDPGTGDVRIWDTATFGEPDSLVMGEHRAVDAHLNGEHLITRTSAGVFLYSVTEERPVIRLPWFSASFRQIAFQPNGELVAVSDSRSIAVWSVETQRPLFRVELDFSPEVMMFTPVRGAQRHLV